MFWTACLKLLIANLKSYTSLLLICGILFDEVSSFITLVSLVYGTLNKESKSLFGGSGTSLNGLEGILNSGSFGSSTLISSNFSGFTGLIRPLKSFNVLLFKSLTFSSLTTSSFSFSKAFLLLRL